MNVITFLRVKHYKPKDKNKKTMPNPQQEIDKKNEESVVGELVDTLGEIVNRYPTLPVRKKKKNENNNKNKINFNKKSYKIARFIKRNA